MKKARSADEEEESKAKIMIYCLDYDWIWEGHNAINFVKLLKD